MNSEKKKKYHEYYRKKRRRVTENEYLSSMRSEENILEIDHLSTCFYMEEGTVQAVDDVSFDIPCGKTVGIVGESGCGKTVTSLSLMGLLPEPQGRIEQGSIRFFDKRRDRMIDLVKLPEKEYRKIRGNDISMIFQEPMTSLNPIYTIGNQLEECIRTHNPEIQRREARRRIMQILRKVGITRESIFDSYPYELSGGMRQRVVIAMALIGEPQLVIADEPTTALDVTTQAQILELLKSLKEEVISSIILITHDLGVIAEMADYVVVMYAGKVIEAGTVEDIFYQPRHPYTVGLMRSKPILNQEIEELYAIPGSVPNLMKLPTGCYFHTRCGRCTDICRKEYPKTTFCSNTHRVSCFYQHTY